MKIKKFIKKLQKKCPHCFVDNARIMKSIIKEYIRERFAPNRLSDLLNDERDIPKDFLMSDIEFLNEFNIIASKNIKREKKTFVKLCVISNMFGKIGLRVLDNGKDASFLNGYKKLETCDNYINNHDLMVLVNALSNKYHIYTLAEYPYNEFERYYVPTILTVGEKRVILSSFYTNVSYHGLIEFLLYAYMYEMSRVTDINRDGIAEIYRSFIHLFSEYAKEQLFPNHDVETTVDITLSGDEIDDDESDDTDE